ncbi:hypothetical protein L6164_019926 [Bauhinia variegata]|uniref:Uncharacterized protein n=1 Tax=Bauhinia variegata TaxID=167791 RepID=A0ACB9MV04_BAUVA|nr:hypothetical protein L6164_019926 [Bauhinia variegata]
MLQDVCFFNKDILVIKPPKKSPLLLRMTVLIFSTVIGVFICTVCLKQINSHSRTKFLEIHVVDKPSQSKTKLTDASYLHYPRPVSFSRNECTRNPVKFFAVLSNQRSGSGWFETLLNSHINVSSNGEIFSVKDRRENISSIFHALDKVYNLDWLSSASKNECSAAVGLKWMLNQADALSKYKPSINSASLLTQLNDMEMRSAKALEYFNSTRHMILYYEDLMRNRTKLNDVQDFLGLPLMELTSRQVKIHRGPLSDHVRNWDDVSKTLRGTAYESFLEADY